MADTVPTNVRSRMMSSIRSGDTQPEMKLRRALHSRGFRYRLHDPMLPGKPDLVFARHRAVLFVHGCFWHRHVGCRYATMPSSNVEFWRNKFEKNIARDKVSVHSLRAKGWRVGIVWECLLRKQNIEEVLSSIGLFLDSSEEGYKEWPPAV